MSPESGSSRASERIRREVASWPGVRVVAHRFGGLEFRVDRRELGHLHGDELADLPFPVRVREELVASGRVRAHHVLPESGWVSYYIRREEDVGGAIELFRLAYERPWRDSPAHDLVDEASEDSFPASDPPSFVPITGVRYAISGSGVTTPGANATDAMEAGNATKGPVWPPLPLAEWRDTYETLHMWSQVVGKIALALTPPVNHFWNTALLVTSRGLSTHPLIAERRIFTLAFDFVDHQLVIDCSDGGADTMPLVPQTVADFYRDVMSRLRSLGIEVRIWPMPVEVPNPVRFDEDVVHRSYDRAPVEAFHAALVSMTPVFERFRARFIGKSSPVHFFWGSFDLAATRFSGRRAPERPGADKVTRESYSHEVISHGFWPGGGNVTEAVFYGYAAPEPAGLREALIRPSAASYDSGLSEFLLPYEAVRRAASPEAELMAFLESTYDASADLGQWNRRELERG